MLCGRRRSIIAWNAEKVGITGAKYRFITYQKLVIARFKWQAIARFCADFHEWLSEMTHSDVIIRTISGKCVEINQRDLQWEFTGLKHGYVHAEGGSSQTQYNTFQWVTPASWLFMKQLISVYNTIDNTWPCFSSELGKAYCEGALVHPRGRSARHGSHTARSPSNATRHKRKLLHKSRDLISTKQCDVISQSKQSKHAATQCRNASRRTVSSVNIVTTDTWTG